MGNVLEANKREGQLRTGDILTADVTLGAVANWTTIGSYTVPDGVAIMVGTGTSGSQADAQGRCYFDIVDDAAGAEEGMIRVVAVDPENTSRITLMEKSTTTGRSGDADTRSGQIPLPERGPWLLPATKIQVEMKPDAAGDIVDVSACTFLLDTTKAVYVPG